MKLFTTAIMLLCSSAAFAGTEAGILTGYSSLKGSEDGSESVGGIGFGLRGGSRMDSGLTIDAQFMRYGGSKTMDLMGAEVDIGMNQMVMGVGTRYYLGDGNITPFVSAHLNYHLEAKAEAMGISASVPESSGIGADAGAGAQMSLGDMLYAEAVASYAMQLTGTVKVNSLLAGVGIGAKF
jgi:hypothetical protein